MTLASRAVHNSVVFHGDSRLYSTELQPLQLGLRSEATKMDKEQGSEGLELSEHAVHCQLLVCSGQRLSYLARASGLAQEYVMLTGINRLYRNTSRNKSIPRDLREGNSVQRCNKCKKPCLFINYKRRFKIRDKTLAYQSR